MLYKCLLSRLLLWTALNLQTFFAVKMPPLKDFVYLSQKHCGIMIGLYFHTCIFQQCILHNVTLLFNGVLLKRVEAF